MIVWFDRDGHISEVVDSYRLVDKDGDELYSSFSANRGSQGAGSIFCYFEGLESATAKNSFIQYRKPDRSLTATYPATDEALAYFEFNPSRDMVRFKYGKQYRFVRFELPDPDVMSVPGSYSASVTISSSDDTAKVFDLLCFTIKSSAIAPEKDITESQFNILLDSISHNKEISDAFDGIWSKATKSLSITNETGQGYFVTNSRSKDRTEIWAGSVGVLSGSLSAYYRPGQINYSKGDGKWAYLVFPDYGSSSNTYFTIATEQWAWNTFVPISGKVTMNGPLYIKQDADADNELFRVISETRDDFYTQMAYDSLGAVDGNNQIFIKANRSIDYTEDGYVWKHGKLAVANEDGTIEVSTPTGSGQATPKSYVDNAIAQWREAAMKIVATLPPSGEPGITYLLAIGGNEYDTYVWEENAWRKIGSSRVDLSDYYTKEQVDLLLPGQSGAPIWPASEAGQQITISFDLNLPRQPRKGDYLCLASVSFDSSLKVGDIYRIASVSSGQGSAIATIEGDSLGNMRGPQGARGRSHWAGSLNFIRAGTSSTFVWAVNIGDHPEATTEDTVLVASVGAGSGAPAEVGDICEVTAVNEYNGNYYLTVGEVIGNIRGPKGDKGDAGKPGDYFDLGEISLSEGGMSFSFQKSVTDSDIEEMKSAIGFSGVFSGLNFRGNKVVSDESSSSVIGYQFSAIFALDLFDEAKDTSVFASVAVNLSTKIMTVTGVVTSLVESVDCYTKAQADAKLETKVNKPANNPTVLSALYFETNGTTGYIAFNQYGAGNALARYMSDGRLKAKDPSETNDLTTKKYVDDLAAGKLDKPATPEALSVISINPQGGTTTLQCGVDAVSNSIAKRTATGQLRAKDPEDERDLTTKKYVDGVLAKKTIRRFSVLTLTNGNERVIFDREGGWGSSLSVFFSRPGAQTCNHYWGSVVKPSRVKTVKSLKKKYLGDMQTKEGNVVSAQEILAFILGISPSEVTAPKAIMEGGRLYGMAQFQALAGLEEIKANSPVFGVPLKGVLHGDHIYDLGTQKGIGIVGGIFHFAKDNSEVELGGGQPNVYHNTIIASIKISLWGRSSEGNPNMSEWRLRSEVLL